MAYDRDNVFARILRGELPCTKVHEDAHVLAFRDINPQAPSHVVLIPKGDYVSAAAPLGRYRCRRECASENAALPGARRGRCSR